MKEPERLVEKLAVVDALAGYKRKVSKPEPKPQTYTDMLTNYYCHGCGSLVAQGKRNEHDAFHGRVEK